MRAAVALVLVLASCARGARVAEMPASVPLPTPAPDTIEIALPPPPDTMVSYRVPPFGEGPLIAWGPTPPGEPRAERTRVYDLQHQATRVRFDWARHAVTGSTTIRFAALERPLTAVAFDAVGMTIRSVRTLAGAPLEHAYDGRSI